MSKSITLLNWNIFIGLGAPSNGLESLLYLAQYRWQPEFVRDRVSTIMEMIADYVGDVNPDIATFQEVDFGSERNHGHNQLDQIVKELGGNYSEYQANGRPPPCDDGLATISTDKYGFQSSVHNYSQMLPEGLQKLGAGYVVQRNYIESVSDELDLVVYTTHLTPPYPPGITDRIRKRQLEDLAEAVVAKKREGYHIIVAGDLNCEHDELEQFLQVTGLRDVVEEPTSPAYDPRHTLDHILVSSGIGVKRVEVDKNAQYSDHLPVYAELVIPD